MQLLKENYESQNKRIIKKPKIVGTFNNHPITLEKFTDNFASTVACVGENFNHETSWMYRSCDFSNLCFDLVENDFIYIVSREEHNLQELVRQYNTLAEKGRRDIMLGNVAKTYIAHNRKMVERWQRIKDPISLASFSSAPSKFLSIGGINPSWTHNQTHGYPILKWFPKQITLDQVKQTSPQGYYQISDPNAVFIPFHSFSAMNVGHLFWDDFLPLYIILNMFGYINQKKKPLKPVLVRYGNMPGKEHALWATCEFRQENQERCRNVFAKFLFAMGIPTIDLMSTREDTKLTLNNTSNHARYVCARNGVAGIGMLTDHGLKKHGWERQDYYSMHNTGRGSTLYNYRNFLMSNMGFTSKEIEMNVLEQSTVPKIVISKYSSSSKPRQTGYDEEKRALKDAFGNRIKVSNHIFAGMSAVEQVHAVKDASIMITSAGGGAVTAMFLPRGASLIVYYSEDSNVASDDNDKSESYWLNNTIKDGHLDWDYLNNMGYLRVHWLPIRRLQGQDTTILVDLIKAELEFIKLRADHDQI